MDILVKTKKKEILDKIKGELEKNIEDWLKSGATEHTLIITLDRGIGEYEIAEIHHVCASLQEVEEKGLMEEYREGKVIISTCC